MPKYTKFDEENKQKKKNNNNKNYDILLKKYGVCNFLRIIYKLTASKEQKKKL